METYERGQPVGDAVHDWEGAQILSSRLLTGRFCRLEQLDAARYVEHLFAADRLDADGASWTYLPYGPFASLAACRV